MQTSETKNTRKPTDLSNAPESMFSACESVSFDENGKAKDIVGIPDADFSGHRALSKLQFSDPCDYYGYRKVQAKVAFDSEIVELDDKIEHEELMKTPKGKAIAAFKTIEKAKQKLAKSMGMTVEELDATMGH